MAFTFSCSELLLLALLFHFLFQQYGIGNIFHVHQHAGNGFAVIDAAEVEIEEAFVAVDMHFLADQRVERGNQTLFGARIVELGDEIVGGVQVFGVDKAGQHVEQVFAAHVFLADQAFELFRVLRADGQVFIEQEQAGGYGVHNLGGFLFRFVCQFVGGEQFADEVGQEQGKV